MINFLNKIFNPIKWILIGNPKPITPLIYQFTVKSDFFKINEDLFKGYMHILTHIHILRIFKDFKVL